jgi:Tol biopolymer transport system component
MIGSARILLAATVLTALAPGAAHAQTCLVSVLGIAIVEPAAESDDARRTGRAVAAEVASRLERDNLFARIPDARFPQGAAAGTRGRPAWEEWRRVGADILMTGETLRLTDGQYEFRFHLWDLRLTREITNIVVTAAPSDWARVADLAHATLSERGVDIAATRCRPPEGQRTPFRRLSA